MKIRTLPATKLASLLCTTVIGALLLFSDKANAISIRDVHEPGSVQFGAASRHSDGSTYVNHLISLAIRGDSNQYFRTETLTPRVASDRMNVQTAGGLHERTTVPLPGGLPGSGTGVPDGGTTVMLLGAALGALGIARRYVMS